MATVRLLLHPVGELQLLEVSRCKPQSLAQVHVALCHHIKPWKGDRIQYVLLPLISPIPRPNPPTHWCTQLLALELVG